MLYVVDSFIRLKVDQYEYVTLKVLALMLPGKFIFLFHVNIEAEFVIKYIKLTLQEKNFNWNLNFAISLMANLLNLNSGYNYMFTNLSMIAYIIANQKSKFAYT